MVGAIALRTGADRGLAAQPVSWSPSPSLRDPGDIAVLMMTSGTTGRPKRVELTYDRMTAAFRAAGLVFDEAHEPHLRGRTDILWASVAHISGLYFAVAHVVEGRTIALLEKFEVVAWTELVRRHRPGYVRLPPTALRMVLQAAVPAETFDSVRAIGSGTAPLPPELMEEFEERYGIPVLGNYGATEFAGAIAGWTLKDKKQWGAHKRGSVGRAHHTASNCASSMRRPAPSWPRARPACSRRAAGSCPERTGPGCAPPISPPSMTTDSCSSAAGRTRRSTGAASRSRRA
jgi:acyl-coenzyme A synthetase/AMP-(fatty) acid ligase